MKKLADLVCNNKGLILIITCILFVLSLIGYKLTEVNYDILVYLPSDIETVEGQSILTNEFNMGAYAVVITNNLNSKEINNLKNSYLEIDGVEKVLSIYDLVGDNIPVEMLPNDLVEKVHDENTDLMFVTFKEGTSSDSTINAIRQMREVASDKAKISGMSSMVVDTMDISKKEIAIYVIIAVILCLIVLELFLDSYLVPILLLANIGISIIFNLGSNIIFGNISYITQSLVAVLQLGVTTDFSIFLYHAYEAEKEKGNASNDAMKEAILKTAKSVTGSSITTIVGFLALCAMDLTLGKDLGLVMAKGVLLGVVCVLTIFPSLILFFDKVVTKTKHKKIKLKFNWLNQKIIKHHKLIFALFIIFIIPIYLAYSKVSVYYKIDNSLPDTLESKIATKEIARRFNIVSPEILLIPTDLKINDEMNMINELKNIDGIDMVISSSVLSNYGITSNMLPDEFNSFLESNSYRIALINSVYEVASDELNKQVEEVNSVISKYDEDIILAGEGALMKDLVSISDNDFNKVNYLSVILVVIVMFVVLKSISLPLLLVITIEFAIFMNMGLSYFGGSILPFVAPIVLGTIQLGATIDYAILLTTNYLTNRRTMKKEHALEEALNYCVPSIIVSGLCFFASTFGVGVYSKIDMIGSLCNLISRGAVISMFVVILILPSVLLIFDKLINKTTIDSERRKNKNMKEKMKKVVALSLTLLVAFHPFSVFALMKEETVYSKLDANGGVKTIIVNDYLNNLDNVEMIEDYSELNDIINLSGSETYKIDDNKLIWDAKGNSILYQGTTTKTLPIEESITYKLDGEDISIDDLIGKNGKVEITIKYNNLDLHKVNVNGKNEQLYTPFVVATTLVVDGNNNKNVIVQNGKVIDNGNKYMVVGVSAPGLYDSLKLNSLKDFDKVVITYETTKFELSSIYTVITPKLIDSEDLKVFSKMDEIYGNVDELQKNMDILEENAKTISDNLNNISDGSLAIYQALNTVLLNMEKVKEGTSQVDAGIKELLSSLNNAKSSINTSKTEEILTSAATKDQLMLQELMKDPVTNKDMIELLELNLQAIGSTSNTLKVISNSIKEMLDAIPKIEELSAGATQINDGIIALETGVTELTTKVGYLNTGIETLNNGTKEFSVGISKYNTEGIKQLSILKDKAYNITTKMNELIKLADNYGTFSSSSNNKEDTVKFIYVVDSIKAKEMQNYTVKEVKKETFLDRIKNLFKIKNS